MIAVEALGAPGLRDRIPNAAGDARAPAFTSPRGSSRSTCELAQPTEAARARPTFRGPDLRAQRSSRSMA